MIKNVCLNSINDEKVSSELRIEEEVDNIIEVDDYVERGSVTHKNVNFNGDVQINNQDNLIKIDYNNLVDQVNQK